jgi:UDP-N-acetylglucosamine 2-epimerase (non-hydrolysing)
VVFTGRRDDLNLTDAQLKELGLVKPAVDLDVEPGPPIVQAARILERYHALVEAQPPSVVVVGEAGAAFACALVAKERGIPVAQIGVPHEGGARALGRTLTDSLADLVLLPGAAARARERAPDPQLVFLEEVLDARAPAEVVPALEALLLASPAR